MAKILGIGGVFFKAKDKAALNAWYQDVLGMPINDWGGAFLLPDVMAAHPGAGTVFSAFDEETDYFAPSAKDFMINLAVDDLAAILERCKASGVEPVKMFDDEPNGRFAHIIDPEGNKIELWQPKPMS